MNYKHLPASAGSWIVKACSTAPAGTIAAQVPSGYRAYARILHPAMDEDGAPVRWERIAATRGRRLEGAELFEDVSGLDEHGDPMVPDAWVEGDVPAYELPIDQWAELAGILGEHTPDGRYVAGLWAGYAFIEGGERIQIDFEPDPHASEQQNTRARVEAVAAAQQPGLPAAIRASPTLDLGGGYRNYHLFELDQQHLANPLWAVTPAGEQRQRPGLLFAPDHSWFVSTEPYDDSTFVGGSAELVAAILASDRLEALEVSEFTRIGHSK